MKTRIKRISFVAFILSIFIHFGSGFFLWIKHVEQPRDNSIEVNIVSNEAPAEKQDDLNSAKQIVEQSEKRINDEKDKDAKYLSRFDQKVVEETRAQDTAAFRNDAHEGLANKSPKPVEKASREQKPKQVAKRTTELQNDDGTVGLPKLAALKPQFQWDRVQGGVTNPGQTSATDDHLSEVKTGAQTLLSTREFVYYSYYQRIKERLRLFWEPKIKEKINRIFMQGRSIASQDERITRLVITLDKEGKLIRVQVLGESGLKDLDDAAVEAFQAAAPFPNPPKGIVEADGTIKIRWDFILEANASHFQAGRPTLANLDDNRD